MHPVVFCLIYKNISILYRCHTLELVCSCSLGICYIRGCCRSHQGPLAPLLFSIFFCQRYADSASLQMNTPAKWKCGFCGEEYIEQKFYASEHPIIKTDECATCNVEKKAVKKPNACALTMCRLSTPASLCIKIFVTFTIFCDKHLSCTKSAFSNITIPYFVLLNVLFFTVVIRNVIANSVHWHL